VRVLVAEDPPAAVRVDDDRRAGLGAEGLHDADRDLAGRPAGDHAIVDLGRREGGRDARLHGSQQLAGGRGRELVERRHVGLSCGELIQPLLRVWLEDRCEAGLSGVGGGGHGCSSFAAVLGHTNLLARGPGFDRDARSGDSQRRTPRNGVAVVVAGARAGSATAARGHWGVRR
jgi:hypothetical protein